MVVAGAFTSLSVTAVELVPVYSGKLRLSQHIVNNSTSPRHCGYDVFCESHSTDLILQLI